MSDVKSGPPLARRLLAEAVGTATVLGLGVLILLFGPVSGAHFNPAVSLADWALGRTRGTGMSGRDADHTADHTAVHAADHLAGSSDSGRSVERSPR